jgi:predicted Zn-dependent protease
MPKMMRKRQPAMTPEMRSPSSLSTPPERPRFLSEADCHDIAHRLARYAEGGGDTMVTIVSEWTGNVRWARNRVTTTGEDRDNRIEVTRNLLGARGRVTINTVTDAALVAAARQAERLARIEDEAVDADFRTRSDSPFRYQPEPFTAPQLFFEETYQVDAERRAAAARQLAQSAADAGMLSAGYLQVSATSTACISSLGYTRYYQYTWAQYSVTVRDPHGVGSGWAGVDWPDWSRIDGEKLSALALDKCLKSRNPVAIEPGRYTTILEPQAVCDFVGEFVRNSEFGRKDNETDPQAPFHKEGMTEPGILIGDPLGISRLGERVLDERITIRADLMDPELGFPPFPKNDNYDQNLFDDYEKRYHPAVWIDHGVLKNESYGRGYATQYLARNTGLPNSGAFRMDGGETPLAEMIATTKRGLLVTRFDQVYSAGGAGLCRGMTRDGLWLIENGKISKAVKNMMFVESYLFALHNIEQLGPPQRVFHPVPGGMVRWFADPQPVIVPPLKIRDFSFTALSEAI